MRVQCPLFLFGALILLLAHAESATAQGANLSFETPSVSDPSQPRDWQIRTQGDEVTLDTVAAKGTRSLRLVQGRPGGSASAFQTVASDTLAGRRVRLSGYIRTRGVKDGTANLWAVIGGAGQEILSTDPLESKGATGTQRWTRYSVEGYLPPEVTQIMFGVSFTGVGTAWFDALTIEAIGVPGTPVPAAVRAYLDSALTLMQTYSIRRDSIDWPSFRATALDDARGARMIADLYPVLKLAIERLGVRHTFFVTPVAAGAPVHGLVAAPTSRKRGSSPTGEMAGQRVGYLWVPGFTGNDPQQETAFADTLQQAMARLDAHGVCGWMVDLRGNTGGNMWPMVAGLGPLLGTGTAGWFVYPGGTRKAWGYQDGTSQENGEPMAHISGTEYRLRDPNPPVAVLTGPSTASSGEAVAVGFRGRPHTRSFGAATDGLSTSNQSFSLPDGAMLIITTSTFADRAGHLYGGVIEPDVKVDGVSTRTQSTDDAVAAAARTWLDAQPACTRGLVTSRRRARSSTSLSRVAPPRATDAKPATRRRLSVAGRLHEPATSA